MLPLLLGALVLAAQTPGQKPPLPQGPPHLFGRVIDKKGSPVEGVAVSLGGQTLKAPQTVKTGSDGGYRFDPAPPGAYTVSFRAPGFEPLNRELTTNEGFYAQVDVTLVPMASGTPIAFTTRSGTNRVGPLVLVRIQTTLGDIDIAVDMKSAPITATNFLKYVDAGMYDGGRFNRVTRPDNYNTAPPNRPMMELIQGGLSPDKRPQAFAPIPLERTNVTGMRHLRGIVSMARGEPDTATSEFFILLDDQPSLDFGGKRFDDNQGAAAFGVVIAGLDVVARIQQQPAEGQNLSPPVPIVSVRRISK